MTGERACGSSPSTTCKSVRQTPQASTFTSSWRGAGTGVPTRESSSGACAALSTIASIVILHQSVNPNRSRVRTKNKTPSRRGAWRRFFVAESEGFEPPIRCRIPDFESGAFDHSANSPLGLHYIRGSGLSLAHWRHLSTLRLAEVSRSHAPLTRTNSPIRPKSDRSAIAAQPRPRRQGMRRRRRGRSTAPACPGI